LTFNKPKQFLLDLFFPKFCLGCRKEGLYLCDDCRAILDIGEFDYCLCGKNPLRLPAEQKKHGKCPRCRDKALSGLYFALSYKEKQLTKKLILQFKYQPHIKDLAKT
jgi:predicted amidophosphoribosyltransferase